jgi:hypothetical protein
MQTIKKSNKVQNARKKLLAEVNEYKQNGDVTELAKRLRYSRVYVSKCLNPATDTWNDKIYSEYKKMVDKRLKKLQIA